MKKISLVITTINKLNKNIKNFDNMTQKEKWNFYVIGDKKTPKTFKLKHGNFFSIKKQKKLKFKFERICPKNSYARKNLGYLISAKNGNDVIVETDDDNYPKKNFFKKVKLFYKTKKILNRSWINIYDFFLKKNYTIWPRGLPLDEINKNNIITSRSKVKRKFLLQQGVCDLNPDVDAIFRLIHKKINIKFKNSTVNLSNALTTFNSQNTRWHISLLPLMYLPVTCTMRCTDIWRSLITLKILKINNLDILFYGTDIYQKRNVHNLNSDFKEEISLYLNSKKIYNVINRLKLKKGFKNFPINMRMCYLKLIKTDIFKKDEMKYLDAWLLDCKNLY